ncbi:murein hydrolase activator EnvC family protein [Methylobacterium gregans]|uniref:Chromosome partition protein Smc n=1 Tax=Methylobacterium gregans TaxID=374424 RepID=A0AA37HT13_9HYPH|nr:peptidoglycan DD-metalloendopeptidase family protein [Methylobacterium gregans]MDQ0524065.1 septal ring factor EnvC (AmiA/AmiB activator) [Methylobacterium gregans]GJD81095.1 Chromosome partition protein Smc [Methylobacterium gregans]GLS56648.1 membrane protein [Methylobacterium gregans]
MKLDLRAPALALLAVLAVSPERARAQDPKPETKAAEPDRIRKAQEERDSRAENLRRIEDALAASGSARAQAEAEISEIGRDRAKLNAALLDAGRQAQATEDRMNRLEERLRTLGDSETAIRRSLDARRGVIAEILAALQRMGRRPPPAVLVNPEDMLRVIRTSMLLGAVVPELRGEVDTLAGDLTELVRLRGLIASDKQALQNDLTGWARERQRLDALVGARRTRQAELESSVASERVRAAELGNQARSLKDLLDRVESEVVAARRAADAAKAAEEREARATQERFAAAGFRDPARLAPKVKFAEARGDIPRPVTGRLVRGFNQPDGNGGVTRGISLSTRAKAVVSSPADGWVAFAGPFRSYGRLLIINAGDGYYLLLAGMDQISVEVGQFVLAGEPVGSMGEGSAAQAAPDTDRTDPVLYVEFKKDGGSIDPEPWWAKSPSEKVRG